MRQLKPEGSLMKDRFQSFVERNLIEPRVPVAYVPPLPLFFYVCSVILLSCYLFIATNRALYVLFIWELIASAADTDSRHTRSTLTSVSTIPTTLKAWIFFFGIPLVFFVSYHLLAFLDNALLFTSSHTSHHYHTHINSN